MGSTRRWRPPLLVDGRPRCRGGHPEAVGRGVRQRLLLGGRRRRRPAGWPTSSASTTTSSTSPTTSTRRGRSLRGRPRRRPDAQPLHRVQPAIKFGAAARPGPTPRIRRSGHRAPCPRRRTTATAWSSCGGAPTRPRTSPTCCPCSAPTELPGRAPRGRADQGEVRAQAAALGLRTAAKPDSQDVCFIHSVVGPPRVPGASASPCTPASSSTRRSGDVVGTVPAVELVTVGQRRGLGVAVDGRRRYALVGRRAGAPHRSSARLDEAVADSRGRRPGRAGSGRTLGPGTRACAPRRAPTARRRRASWQGDAVVFDEPQPLVAPGQTVALYDDADPDCVVGRSPPPAP